MGSSGSGNFSDYSGAEKDESGGGGSSGVDRCGLSFDAELEDVARGTYFSSHQNVPLVRTTVTITLVQRMVARTSDGDVVGYLPTQYNYLAGCIKAGWRYPGVVTNTTLKPFPRVFIRVNPDR